LSFEVGNMGGIVDDNQHIIMTSNVTVICEVLSYSLYEQSNVKCILLCAETKIYLSQ